MGSNQNPTALWRKSSYSGNTGGECVECAPLGGAAWRKASYSANGECVEVAAQPCRVAVRDSKDPDGPAFTVGAAAFAAFVRSL
ncbi:hypothetical protein GCM10010215_18230 [Streptomyces virginiae]|uniref:DUF397 domain-containing protein n=1 Tax=Streptomyces virginiae TaxID=1961 RepID=A0ABQ3NX50_STRVG|nr:MULTISPECIES: DUF397 domain-containing protein [Streptomyces]KOU93236.1 toxin [Streptomyces sp. XY593]KOU93539.1 toxin [Streptomyces sp. XY533]KOU98014.1 toxin [Streptomyces sp. XY511]MBP2344289.1 hypothetical protein [Streptomyces virginiae]GGP92798.1 hypothetical protein GCM10010215_18230 [Streptomyces virginiae]